MECCAYPVALKYLRVLYNKPKTQYCRDWCVNLFDSCLMWFDVIMVAMILNGGINICRHTVDVI